MRKDSKKRKPNKPYPAYPLWANSNGQWAKSIRNKTHNFGKWDDPEAALRKYQETVDALQFPADDSNDDDPTVADGINKFLAVQKQDCKRGDISDQHYSDLERTLLETLPKAIIEKNISDLTPSDFRLMQERFRTKKDKSEASPATMMGHIRRVKILFRWLKAEAVIESLPSMGSKFGKLSNKQKMTMAVKTESKQFTREEIHQLLDASDTPRAYRLRAMVLLGINAAMGPTDIAQLCRCQLNLENGWLHSRRGKTTERKCVKLWPETVEAIQKVLDKRPVGFGDQIFITKHGNTYEAKGAISRIFAKLKLKTKIEAGDGKSFYTLRHQFRDIANEQRDDHATRWVMGHKSSSIDDQYTRTPPQQRIELVCNHVRTWLFGDDESDGDA